MNKASTINKSAILSFPHLIEGPRLKLRELCAEDANNNYARWMNDPEVNRFTESRYDQHTPESLNSFITTIINSSDQLILAIVVKENDQHIGNIKLGDIKPNHGTADIGIIIGEKDLWGYGYASEAINVLAEYAFNAIGLYKLTAGSYMTNKGSIRAFEKSGFEIEGILKEHCISDGKRVDVALLRRLCNTSNIVD